MPIKEKKIYLEKYGKYNIDIHREIKEYSSIINAIEIRNNEFILIAGKYHHSAICYYNLKNNNLKVLKSFDWLSTNDDYYYFLSKYLDKYFIVRSKGLLFYDINNLEMACRIEENWGFLYFNNNILTSLCCGKFEEWKINNFKLEKISEYNIKKEEDRGRKNFIKTKRGNIIFYEIFYGDIYIYKIIKK